MSNYDLPDGPPLDAGGRFTPAWAQWLTRTHASVRSLQDSGPTTQRPDSLLWIGRSFFDTTLGQPIWVQSVPPAPAPAVWCDATGTAV